MCTQHPRRIYDYLDKFTFLCEMYDEHSDSIRSLVLNFFPFDNSVQVVDSDKGTTMLKRVQLPTLSTKMLQLGNIVNIFEKLLYITDAAPATRRILFDNVQSTFALIKPTPPSLHGKIITFIMKNGFRIVRMKNGKLDKDFAMMLYSHVTQNLPLVIDYVTSEEVIGLELVGPDAVEKWKHCLGATDPKQASKTSLRGLYGSDVLRNVAHASNTPQDAARNTERFFGYENGAPRIHFRATFKDCTCCIIKPHAIIDDNVGQIYELISANFLVSALAMFSVSMSDAHEFYEVYEGVVPEYEAMSIHLAEGKCIVLEIKFLKEHIESGETKNKHIVTEFRNLCGPRDPDLCRQLYPGSVRALYGKDIVHNAVHCTDLEEDGEAEVEYFFKLLANV